MLIVIVTLLLIIKGQGVGVVIIGPHPHRMPAAFDFPGTGGTKLVHQDRVSQAACAPAATSAECSIDPGAQQAPAQAFEEQWKGEPRSLKTSSWSQDESEDPHTEPRQSSTLEPGGVGGGGHRPLRDDL